MFSFENLRKVSIYALFGMLLGISINIPSSVWQTKPYKSVKVTDFREDATGYYIRVTFRKTGCIFRKLEAHARELGDWDQLEVTDIEGDKGNRVEGWHSVRLKIAKDDPSASYDRLEVRTRHFCPTEDVPSDLDEQTLDDKQLKSLAKGKFVDYTFFATNL